MHIFLDMLIYKYSRHNITFSSSSDVTVSTPTIYYNAYNKTWTVTCGGYWKNMNWEKDKALLVT